MQQNNAFKGLIALVILGGLIAGTIILTGDDDSDNSDDAANTTTQQTETTAEQTTPPASQDSNTNSSQDSNTQNASNYSDGTYTASGSYSSPGGVESIVVTVSLEDDVIQTVSVVPEAEHPTSKQFQESFVEGIVELVTGVNIDQAEVDQVSSSSLTSRGFNDALSDIRTQAEA